LKLNCIGHGGYLLEEVSVGLGQHARKFYTNELRELNPTLRALGDVTRCNCAVNPGLHAVTTERVAASKWYVKLVKAIHCAHAYSAYYLSSENPL
jgi:hypothetical protein